MTTYGAAPCPLTAGGAEMRPAKAKLKKFRLNPKYTHHRSEGLTRRQNAGTKRLIIDRKEVAKDFFVGDVEKRAGRTKDG